ncbi:hypothetical protein OSO01_41340 [Oceanobacillus sojae]|uniref:Uncharacterized protein n=1 Tax=Oceanobacillus sojae TaxID=582851 RepID=A0A511ZPL8_9BACI|nr:hypothetical protein OSO01_41340 [Oceanobacillus sojae]
MKLSRHTKLKKASLLLCILLTWCCSNHSIVIRYEDDIRKCEQRIPGRSHIGFVYKQVNNNL